MGTTVDTEVWILTLSSNLSELTLAQLNWETRCVPWCLHNEQGAYLLEGKVGASVGKVSTLTVVDGHGGLDCTIRKECIGQKGQRHISLGRKESC